MPPSFYHRRHPRPPSYLPLGFHPPPPPSLPLPPPTTLSLRLPSLSDSPIAEGGECGARTALSFAFFFFFFLPARHPYSPTHSSHKPPVGSSPWAAFANFFSEPGELPENVYRVSTGPPTYLHPRSALFSLAGFYF